MIYNTPISFWNKVVVMGVEISRSGRYLSTLSYTKVNCFIIRFGRKEVSLYEIVDRDVEVLT